MGVVQLCQTSTEPCRAVVDKIRGGGRVRGRLSAGVAFSFLFFSLFIGVSWDGGLYMLYFKGNQGTEDSNTIALLRF